MMRFVLRQYRWLIVSTVLLTVLLGALLLWQGLKTGAFTAQATAAGCPDGPDCASVQPGAISSYKNIGLPMQFFVFAPAVIGAAWGAPLLARELDQRTAILAWTQSITRRRWLGTRLLVLGVIIAACGGLTGAAITWWSERYRSLYTLIGVQPQAMMAQIRGYGPAIWWLFAFLVGAAAGLLIKRTLPAIAATAGVLLITSISLSIIPGAVATSMKDWGAELAVAQAPEAGVLAGLSVLLVLGSFQLIDRATA